MPYADRVFTCRCGTEFRKRAPAGSDQLCIMCRIEAMAASITQMHAKSGPAWDAWCDRVHRLIGCPLADPQGDVGLAAARWLYDKGGSRGTPSPGT